MKINMPKYKVKIIRLINSDTVYIFNTLHSLNKRVLTFN